MSYKDIFKNAFLDAFANGLSIKMTILSLCIAAALAIYIFCIYRIITKKTFYSKTFNISIVAMAIITAAIILTIQSNIVLSLGMVGALSIVRFRTAIKDPLDLMFLYWSISTGIICGAGLSVIAIALALLMTIIVFTLQIYPIKKSSMILVVNCSSLNCDKNILQITKEHSKYYKVKSKSITSSSLDMIIEIKIDENSDLLQQITKIDGVVSASILTHDGEISA